MSEDQRSLESSLAKLLGRGSLVAGVLLFLGWMTQIQGIDEPFAAFQVYHDLPFLNRWNQLWLEGRWGLLFSYVGLWLLIILPFLRVVLSAFVFSKKGEALLAAFAVMVLVGLFLGLGLGVHA